jgi:hypothetical protein
VVNDLGAFVGYRVLGEAWWLGAQRESISHYGLLAAEFAQTLNTIEATKARDLSTKVQMSNLATTHSQRERRERMIP